MFDNNKKEFNLFYRIFVDDGLTAAPRLSADIVKVCASSMESAYILLGYPGPIKKPLLPPTIAADKMVDHKIGPKRVNLGIFINTKDLTVLLKDYKVERLKHLLNNMWALSRNKFTARLIGNIFACAQVYQWLQWSIHHLVEELKRLLQKNAL